MNFKHLNALTASALALILSACAGVPNGGVGSGGNGGGSGLQGVTWEVETINGIGVTTQIRPTLNFGNTLQVTGHTSCNHYFAGYIASGSAMLIKKAGTTKMACVDNTVAETENRFLNQLLQTQAWTIDSTGKLSLMGTTGAIVAKRK